MQETFDLREKDLAWVSAASRTHRALRARFPVISMIKIPAFRANVRVNALTGEGIIVSGETSEFAYGGELEEAVTMQVNGSRTVDDIAETLAPRFSRDKVYSTLAQMQRRGVVYDGSTLSDQALPFDWHYLVADLSLARRSINDTRVNLLETSSLPSPVNREAFIRYGLQLDARGPISVVLSGDYLDQQLADINRLSLKNGSAWMLARPVGTQPLIGPVFRPGDTACWECLARRLRLRNGLDQYGKARSANCLALSQPFEGSTPTVESLVAYHTAIWVVTGGSPLLDGKIISLDLTTLATAMHVVSKDPDCPACGNPTNMTIDRPRFDNRPRKTSIDTGHRAASPEDTYAKYQNHVSPITGLVSSITPLRAPSDEIIKLSIAHHNFALDNGSLRGVSNSMDNKSCGKGITETQARVGALCEALERYSGRYRGNESRIRASLRQIGCEAIHPNACMLFSDRQYQERERWRALGSVFSLVPAPFSEDEVIEWSPIWSFGSQSFRYLPTSYLYYAYPSGASQSTCWADSNGNAAGNTLEEAAFQGFLELVERDAVAIWWYNRLSRPGVDLNSFDHPYIGKCLDFYARHGRQFWALDLTTDFAIPTFAAISRRVDQPSEEITFGFGSHLDAKVALVRAIAEMNQFLPVVEGPIGSDGKRVISFPDEGAVHWWRTASVYSEPYLLPHPRLAQHRASDFPNQASDDQLVDVMTCVARAAALGLDTLFLDQTRGDVGLPTAKIVMPGARHFWARLASGRLYDVPVRLGWLPAALTEGELNPIPMFV